MPSSTCVPWSLIALDYVLRKGTQSNWREKQARICVLCDAFCLHLHTALPRVKGVHQPRDSAVFPLQTNNRSSSSSKQQKQPAPLPPKHHRQRTGTGDEGQKRGEQQYAIDCVQTLPPRLRPPVLTAVGCSAKTDDDSHARTAWFDVDDASETVERHDICGSYWGRPALGVDRHSASGGRPLSSSPRERQVAERPLVALGVERARASREPIALPVEETITGVSL